MDLYRDLSIAEEEEDAFDKLLGTGQLDVKIGSEENPFS